MRAAAAPGLHTTPDNPVAAFTTELIRGIVSASAGATAAFCELTMGTRTTAVPVPYDAVMIAVPETPFWLYTANRTESESDTTTCEGTPRSALELRTETDAEPLTIAVIVIRHIVIAPLTTGFGAHATEAGLSG
jgi:hypothetical protein